MRSLRPFLDLLGLAPRRRLVALLALMIGGGLSEGVGIVLLVPLLQALTGQGGAGPWPVRALTGGMTALGIATAPGGILIAFVVLVGVRNAVQHGRDRLAAQVRYAVVDRLRDDCFATLLGAEWRWVLGGRRSDHMNLLVTDINRVGTGFGFALALLATAATIGVSLLAASMLSWRMTALALLTGGAALIVLAGQRRKALALGDSLGSANRAVQASVHDSLTGLKLAKVLRAESRHLAAFRRSTWQLRSEQLRFVAGASLSNALFQTVGAALLAACLYAGIAWHAPVPALLTLVLVFARLVPLFAAAQQQHHHWLHAAPALAEAQGLLADGRAHAEPVAEDDPAPVLGDGIRLDSVTVRYDGRAAPALEDVCLFIPARTTVAILGPSGAGKSTLADVLMGLVAPDDGVVEIGGVPLTGAVRRAWRQAVAYVPQEVFLFNDTVRANLALADPAAGEGALCDALRRAAADFVFDLPRGLDTPVGDGGARLSGGERQRLALARALLARPALLILDEATSALDPDNEARVRTAIGNLRGDLTVVMIGHRPAGLDHADRVVVLDRGRLVASGPWEAVRPAVGAPA